MHPAGITPAHHECGPSTVLSNLGNCPNLKDPRNNTVAEEYQIAVIIVYLLYGLCNIMSNIGYALYCIVYIES